MPDSEGAGSVLMFNGFADISNVDIYSLKLIPDCIAAILALVCPSKGTRTCK